jgi:DNA-binding response OmpR family regulator
MGLPLRLVLASSREVIELLVRACLEENDSLIVRKRADIVEESRSLSEYGLDIVREASNADALIVEWQFEEAPSINTLCYNARRTSTPVIAVCTGGQSEVAEAIAAGSDFALPLPLDRSTIASFIFSYRRITDQAKVSQKPMSISADDLRFGPLALSRSAHQFSIRGQPVELTPREYRLIEFMIQRAGSLCSRDEILDGVWGIRFDTGTNMVDVYMHFLRKKMEAYGETGLIETIRGYGYRLRLQDEPRG